MDLIYCMYSVCKSAKFAKLIVSQTLDDNKSCVSFHVVSLFNIVPTDRAIQVACQCLQNDPSLAECTSLTKTSNLLEFCLNTTYSLYQQVHGTAVGCPIFIAIANLRSHRRRRVSSRCLFLLCTPLLEMIRRQHLLRTLNRPHTRFPPPTKLH